MDWWATPRAQRSIQAVGAAVAEVFGDSSKETPGAQLRRGYLGTAIDDTHQCLVVVVDPTLVDVQDVASTLTAAAGTNGVTVRVVAAKTSAADVGAAERAIAARDWHPDASKVSIGSHLDPVACQYVVTFRESEEAVAFALQARLGEWVRIQWGTPQRRSDSSADGPGTAN